MCAMKSISLSSFILTIFITRAFCGISLPEDVYREKSVQCVITILEANVPCSTDTSVLGKEEHISNFIKRINENSLCFTFLVLSYKYHRFNTGMGSDVYILIIDSINELEQGIYNISTSTFWDPANKILIYHYHLVTNTTLWSLFNIALTFRMYNMLFVGNVNDEFGIYTYHPFANRNCGLKFDYIEKISDCSNTTNFTDMFPKIYQTDFVNCTLRVAIAEDLPHVIIKPISGTNTAPIGIEQLTIETAAKDQGMRVQYITGTTIYGFVLKNRSVTGLLGLVKEGKADFAAGGMILTLNRAEVFSFIHGPKLSRYTLYSHAFKIPKWKNLYREFAGTLWTLTVFVSILLIIFMLGCKYLLSGGQRIDIINHVLMLYGYFFSNPSSVLNRDRSFRTFLGFWMIFTMYMSNSYLSKLCSLVLLTEQRVREDVTASELVANPNRIPCISNVTLDFFAHLFDNISSSDNRIRLPECERSGLVLDAVAANENYYTLELDYVYEMKDCSLLDESGKPKIAQWPADTFNVYLSVYYYKGFPLKERFHYISHRIYEVGIIAKKISDINNEKNIGCGKRIKTFHVYSLGDMRLAFYVLFFGILMSFIIFLCEILLQKRKVRFILGQ